MKNLVKRIFCLGLVVGLLGCGLSSCVTSNPGQQAAVPVVDPRIQPISPKPYSKNVYSNGSLVSFEQSYNNDFSQIFSSRRARHVNDIVYILISEDFKGKGKASPTSDGSNSTKYSVPTLFDLKKHLGGLGAMNTWLEASRENKTEGSGQTERSNTLVARIAARVIEILPNGDFRIIGTHYTKVNNEDHYVTVSGIIRPTDITADNYIMSSAIANAHIEYSGTGSIGTQQRVGWGTRILNIVWPF
jgi:flagellar L-ring protein precursor FlgH